MLSRAFDPESFYARVGATPRERAAIRQDLIKGLKDYFEAIYGYDRYGGETALHVRERLGEPVVFGYAALRLLRDRRLQERTRAAVAQYALDVADYGEDRGLPHGFFASVSFLALRGLLPLDDLRYVLVVSAGEYQPLRGTERSEYVAMFRYLLSLEVMTPAERLFWGHSLLARHQDMPAGQDLADALLGAETLDVEGRRELCHAWLHFRQPRIDLDVPGDDDTPRRQFVAEHMGFWIVHSPSWPSEVMVRAAILWLPRLGEDVLAVAGEYIGYRGTYADHVLAAVADMLAEQRDVIAIDDMRALLDLGIAPTNSIATRRRFYRLGFELFGSQYLERAAADSATSVRQWATRTLSKLQQ